MPGLEWIERKSFQFPIVLATWEQQMEYFSERRPVQVLSQMIAQIDHIFSRRQLPFLETYDNLYQSMIICSIPASFWQRRRYPVHKLSRTNCPP